MSISLSSIFFSYIVTAIVIKLKRMKNEMATYVPGLLSVSVLTPKMGIEVKHVKAMKNPTRYSNLYEKNFSFKSLRDPIRSKIALRINTFYLWGDFSK